MTKLEFILSLNEKLSHLPKSELKERLNFYTEMIEDRIEEGLSEEEAVAAVGSVDEIAAQITKEIPVSKKPKKKLSALEIILLILGSPVWISLGLAAFAVIFSLYICLWAVIISLWAVFASFIGVAFGGLVFSLIKSFSGNVFTAAAVFGASLVIIGLSIFAFLGCKYATKGVVKLTKKIAFSIKNKFCKKEAA